MTLKKITTLLASMLFITSTGCNSTSDSQLKQTLLVNAADEQVAEIISRILDADKVRLSGGVFTQQSSLVLSHPNVVDSQGNPIMGKQFGIVKIARLPNQSTWLTTPSRHVQKQSAQ